MCGEPILKSDEAQAQVSDEQFQKDLAPLCERWRNRQKQDLELRYDTGKALNDRLGTPEKRQGRGEGVLKKVAEQLHVAVSELSRMRSFACHCQSLEDFQRQHPEATTWTAVKKLLPKATAHAEPAAQPTDSTQQASKPRKPKAPKHDALTRSLAELSSKLRKVDPDLKESRKKELTEAIQELVEAAPSCLKIRLSVGEVAEKTTPSTGEAEETPPSIAPNPQAA